MSRGPTKVDRWGPCARTVFRLHRLPELSTWPGMTGARGGTRRSSVGEAGGGLRFVWASGSVAVAAGGDRGRQGAEAVCWRECRRPDICSSFCGCRKFGFGWGLCRCIRHFLAAVPIVTGFGCSPCLPRHGFARRHGQAFLSELLICACQGVMEPRILRGLGRQTGSRHVQRVSRETGRMYQGD